MEAAGGVGRTSSLKLNSAWSHAPNDTSTVLLVRIVDTVDVRMWGLLQVGPAALATTVVLHDQRREVTTRRPG